MPRIKRARVAIVGAGHYGKMIAPKYMANDRCLSLVTVSPHSRIEGIPAFKTIAEERKYYKADIYDLCVFPDRVIPILQELLRAGARRFILPKLYAETEKGLNTILTLKRRYGATMLISSQYHYWLALHAAIGMYMDRPGATADFVFSQELDQSKYTPHSAHLMHILQICHDTGMGMATYSISIGSDTRARRLWLYSDIGKTESIDLDQAPDLLQRMASTNLEHIIAGQGKGIDIDNHKRLALGYIHHDAWAGGKVHAAGLVVAAG